MAAYGLGNARVRLIRHNENLTYCVEERFLLRVHRSASGFETELLAPSADRAARCESELDYIEALGQAGFAPLQRPVRNLRGQWATRLSGGAPATLLTWLAGEDAGKAPLTPARCRQWGRRIAELHAVSRRLSRGPAPLRYDAALAERCARRAEELARKGVLSAAHARDVALALEGIGRFLEDAERGQPFFRVHADLSPGNLIVTKEGLAPIDFSLSGDGHAVMDLAVPCSALNAPELCMALKAGYEEASGSCVDARAYDMLFALAVLLFIVCQGPRYVKEDWLSRRLDHWCGRIFRPLMRGERIDP